MRFNKHFILFSFVISLLLYPVLAENPKQVHISNTSQNIDHVIWDGNNISTWHGNHGDIVSYHVTSHSGLEWPKGSGKTAVFQAGLWLAAGKVNGIEEIRIAVSEYQSEFIPGNWRSYHPKKPPLHNPSFRIYEINNEDGSGSINWQEWPIEQGAPWVDSDHDGIYSPFKLDYPDIIGDKVHWYVMNDGDIPAHEEFFESEPLDVEVRVSLFGFDIQKPLSNTLFVKYQIINKGENQLDSMYISFWSDPDIGDPQDDLVGCDPERNLGFAYNDSDGDEIYGENPPAVGFLLLQTAIVPSIGDTAHVSGTAIVDFTNIPVTSFTKFIPLHTLIDYNKAWVAYNYMNGLTATGGSPYIDPVTGQPTTFVNNGDPITGEGWIDGIIIPPGDRRIFLSSGPFSMAPGDTQEVVMALIISQGESNINSVEVLKSDAILIKNVWDSNFVTLGNSDSREESLLPSQFALNQPHPNPFNPATTIEFSIPQSGIVNLTVYDVLGRKVETILKQYMDAGYYKVQWNASNTPSGIYFVRMLHSHYV